MKRVLPAFLLILLSCAVAAFIYKDRIFPKPAGELAGEVSGRGGGGPGRRGGGADADRPVSVLAVAARRDDVPVYLHGVGTVQAFNAATVRAQVTGRLIEVNFVEGASVRKGDVLAKIDPASYQAAYDQAVAKKAMSESVLANARADLQRYAELAKSNYGSQKQADTQQALVTQSEAQIRQDQAAIDSAKTNLDHTTVRAPFDGRTGIREVDVGNLVTPGDAGGIVTIAQLQPISVLFTLPETHVGDLIQAMNVGRVGLVASAGGKTAGEGVLEVIDNRIDQSTGTVRLKGAFPNEKLNLWPGQFVSIRVHLKMLPQVTVVPSQAVQQGASGRFVYVVQPGNTVKLTDVEVTQEGEELAVIAKGVAPDEWIVTSGFANLQDGAKIAPTYQDWPAAAPVDADAAADKAPPVSDPARQPRRGERSGLAPGNAADGGMVAQGQAGQAR